MATENAPQYNPNEFDSSTFDVASYSKRVDKPWGWELHLVPEETPYMLKIIHVIAGARLSEQVHDKKQESWTLMNGRAAVVWQNNQGEEVTTELEVGKGYSTKLGQPHRLVGITDCDIVEASTPEAGTTYRLQDDYSRPDETPEQRKIERA